MAQSPKRVATSYLNKHLHIIYVISVEVLNWKDKDGTSIFTHVGPSANGLVVLTNIYKYDLLPQYVLLLSWFFWGDGHVGTIFFLL